MKTSTRITRNFKRTKRSVPVDDEEMRYFGGNFKFQFPLFLYRYYKYILQHGIKKGVFSQPGDTNEVHQMIRTIEKDTSSVQFQNYGIHSVCTIITKYFLQLEEPIFSYDDYDEILELGTRFIMSPEFNETSEKIKKDKKGTKKKSDLTEIFLGNIKKKDKEELKDYVQSLPKLQFQCLKSLFGFLYELSLRCRETKMSSKQLSLVFHKCIFRPREMNQAYYDFDSKIFIGITQMMIERFGEFYQFEEDDQFVLAKNQRFIKRIDLSMKKLHMKTSSPKKKYSKSMKRGGGERRSKVLKHKRKTPRKNAPKKVDENDLIVINRMKQRPKSTGSFRMVYKASQEYSRFKTPTNRVSRSFNSRKRKSIKPEKKLKVDPEIQALWNDLMNQKVDKMSKRKLPACEWFIANYLNRNTIVLAEKGRKYSRLFKLLSIQKDITYVGCVCRGINNIGIQKECSFVICYVPLFLSSFKRTKLFFHRKTVMENFPKNRFVIQALDMGMIKSKIIEQKLSDLVVGFEFNLK